MSVLVFAESTGGRFKKSTFEAVTYGTETARLLGADCRVISIGEVKDGEIKKLSQYGAKKIIQATDQRLKNFISAAYASVIAEAAKAESAKVIIISASFSGRGLAPRVAVKLDAGFADGAISLPDLSQGFVVRKTAFSGKAFADVSLKSEMKVISLVPNSYKVSENPVEAETTVFSPALNDGDFRAVVKESVQSSEKVLLPEAEIVVSGGRGLKGPENWKMIEELAGLLGAATACSKPVSDAGWRPHSEHVGQTGIAISPNLYIAIGISGAIQHLAGVSASKTIVVINKDAEAPFFKAADYGINGDAFEIVPRLIEAVKKHKEANA